MMDAVAIRGRGVAPPAPDDLEDRFPGRWNARRPFHDEARSAIAAIEQAMRHAGWLTALPVVGGLVVGCDLAGLEPARRLARALRADAPGPLSPSDFLYALPSSIAATAGVALGLADYQATYVEGGLAGIHAAHHAAELVATGRAKRMVAVAVTRVGGDAAGWLGALDTTLAVAWCLDLEAGHGVPEIRLDDALPDREAASEAVLLDLAPAVRDRAAPGLLALDRLLDGPASTVRVVHHDRVLGGTIAMTVRIHPRIRPL